MRAMRAAPAQVDTDFSNDDDVRAILIVHDTKPPFLDGRVSYTKQAQAVLPLRDPTSDMAVIARRGRWPPAPDRATAHHRVHCHPLPGQYEPTSGAHAWAIAGVICSYTPECRERGASRRNGSSLVREVREKKEKGKSRQRFWELAGSKMGQITGSQMHPAHARCPLAPVLCMDKPGRSMLGKSDRDISNPNLRVVHATHALHVAPIISMGQVHTSLATCCTLL